MKIKNSMAALALAFASSITVQAYPCVKYAFHFYSHLTEDLPPGDVTLTWKIQSDCGFPKEKIETKKFAISLTDFFEQAFFEDTVDTPMIHFKITGKEPLFVYVQEIGTDHQIRLTILPRGKALPPQTSRIDSLNFALLHGYFAHAIATLYKMNRPELVREVVEQHQLLFPMEYRGSEKIFNSYFDPKTNILVKMPYVTGSKEFLARLKEKMTPVPKPTLEIYATIEDGNRIDNLSSIPPVDEGVLLQALQVLQIETHEIKSARLVLIIDTSKNNWKFINKRALTDPSSKDFKLRPRMKTGAIH